MEPLGKSSTIPHDKSVGNGKYGGETFVNQVLTRARLAQGQMPRPYGEELVLNLHGCDPATFNRDSIERYFTELCRLIEMRKCEVHFWDDLDVPEEERETSAHTKGTSAVCFILTSSIVIHTLDLLEAVYVNIFSCKHFDPALARKFTEDWFGAKSSSESFLERT